MDGCVYGRKERKRNLGESKEWQISHSHFYGFLFSSFQAAKAKTFDIKSKKKTREKMKIKESLKRKRKISPFIHHIVIFRVKSRCFFMKNFCYYFSHSFLFLPFIFLVRNSFFSVRKTSRHCSFQLL